MKVLKINLHNCLAQNFKAVHGFEFCDQLQSWFLIGLVVLGSWFPGPFFKVVTYQDILCLNREGWS